MHSGEFDLPAVVEKAFARLERETPDFEHRPAQARMAQRWSGTLAAGGVLAVEAPTGVGKSLAYLVPSLALRAGGSGTIVVSTHTKALQEQLIGRDVPLAARALGRPVRAATLKGRASYLCRRRAHARLRQRRLFTAAGRGAGGDAPLDAAFLERLESWIDRTSTGELEELSALGLVTGGGAAAGLAAEIASDPIFCSGPECDPASGCFAKAARREARRADVLIVNHALLLSDPGLRQSIVAEAGALILDEAHQLERVARDALGITLGLRDLARLASRTDARGGALRGVARAIRRGKGQELSARLVEADRALRPVLDHAAALTRDLEALLPDGLAAARLSADIDLAAVSPAALDQLLGALGTLVRALESAGRAAETEAGALRPGADDALQELQARTAAWIETEQALRALLRLEDRDQAYYLDRDERGAPRLNRRPLRVARALRETLFAPSDRVLLTSATLAPGGDFGPLLRAVGLEAGEAATECLDSPFPLERMVRCVVLEGAAPTDRAYVDELAALLVALAPLGRSTLVLLTSFAMLESLAARLRAPLAAAGVPLLAQAPGEPAAPLADAFRDRPGSVLLGTASFWEGVDFPGSALEILVIARLPFPVPTDPVVEARSERIAAEGGDPFRELMLPEAVLRFRQGVGRLIRGASDRGVVLVADPRLVRSTYGARFAACLPARPMTARTPAEASALARDFMEREALPWPA
ncbi:MAG TPA: helicase C-terminal domain-containing protein [Candidatus Eisenbacteria bacterium]|nr:helicase C-terminal domain-containing protein [Candidatus Eisenbacteria bacterium]